MKVCDDKITKLKQRIKSELPVYSQDQMNPSRAVTLECALGLGSLAGRLQSTQVVFNSPQKEDILRKVFKDQTEKAILKSRQIANTRGASARVQMVQIEHKQSPGKLGGALLNGNPRLDLKSAPNASEKSKLEKGQKPRERDAPVKKGNRAEEEEPKEEGKLEGKGDQVRPVEKILRWNVY